MAAEAFKVKPTTDPSGVDFATDVGGDGKTYQLEQPAFGPDAGTKVMVDDVAGSRLPVGGAQIGAVDETAPASDTASSGLSGRLQRLAQRITTLIGVTGDTADAAVTTDASGTVNAHLRGIVTQLGAVTASPVANSIADRLKQLLTGIVLAAGTNIIGKILSTETSLSGTITSGTATTTAGLDTRGYKTAILALPAAFTATIITFSVCDTLGGTYQTLYGWDGAIIQIPNVVQGRSYLIPPEVMRAGFHKVLTNVNEGGTRTIAEYLKS